MEGRYLVIYMRLHRWPTFADGGNDDTNVLITAAHCACAAFIFIWCSLTTADIADNDRPTRRPTYDVDMSEQVYH
ncbi:Hypothetical protein NTJ_16038 [Nesidiocoris tenuis]|uniref:Uncharacterized protein n=1 Tax=Nesidiocoris tenuis TaxID=355587 RepID=A0ABN7BGZ1_9HEMI|nr:Hypothetical protein NTJ_16038 [Nesidiocoris tenuis]